MRTVTAPFLAALSSSSSYIVADVIGIYLADGTYQSLTFADSNVTPWGTTYTPYPMRHSGFRTTDNTEITTCALELARKDSTVKAARDYDGCRINFARCFFSSVPYTTASFIGTYTQFTGFVYDVQETSEAVVLNLKSSISKMERPLNPRIIQKQCPYMVYASGSCGVSSASFTGTLGVTSGTVSTVVTATSSSMSTAGSWILFLDGALSGTQRTITQASGTTLYISPELSAAPASGTNIKVYRGCDKTLSTCRSTFNNAARYGGFNAMPNPEILSNRGV